MRLKRKILIREYDFNKLKSQALTKDYHGESLYDRATFTPITKNDLDKEYMLFVLLRDENDLTSNPMNSWKPTEFPNSYLLHVRKQCYNKEYPKWKCRFDDDGYLLIRYNKGTPETKIGWGMFEKEY